MNRNASKNKYWDLLQKGNIAGAEELLLGVLSKEPENHEALHALGLVRSLSGKADQAVLLLRKACELAAGNARFYSDLAITLAGQNRVAEAVSTLNSAVASRKNDPAFCFVLAESLVKLGDVASARRALESAVTAKPDYFEARVNLSELCRTHDDTAAALTHLHAAVTLRPRWAEGHNALGLLYEKVGLGVEARFHFSAALEIAPSMAEARNNLGISFANAGDVKKAIESYRAALSARPEFPEALYNLGNALRDIEEYDAAILSFRAASRLRPSFVEALANAGEALDKTGDYEAAEASFEALLALNGADARTFSSLLCELNYDLRFTPAALYSRHRQFGAMVESHVEPILRTPLRQNSAEADRKLRIGYVSADFNTHPVARFMEPVFRNHNRSRFEIFCYSCGEKTDAQTDIFKHFCNSWIESGALSDQALCQRIRNDGIDILVDLSGHSAGNRLTALALKPAPLQITYLGFPNTTGLSSIDYRITDSIADPPGESRVHSEALFHLDECFCCYSPPPSAPEVGPLPADTTGTITFGSTHTLARLNNRVIDLWSAVLHAAPNSQLLVFRTTLRGVAAARLRDRFEQNGIASERIIMRNTTPARGHLAVYDEIDIMLDTLPWSGHASACEALWMGVPIVTLSGDRFAGRMVTSVLSALGLTNCIAKSSGEFIEKSCALAATRDTLRQLRQTLRTIVASNILCNGPKFTAGLESAYLRMWNAAQTGTPIDS
jgi:predicted O-linked N-acetylglucosamine transferase (SPINDLY family)